MDTEIITQEENHAPQAATETPEVVVCPLISCIMPTAGRPGYVARAVQYFHNQDYPNRELIIVYNKPTDLPPGWHHLRDIPGAIPMVRLVEAGTKIVGAKRNEACRHARGIFIAHWDDDDINNRNRLSVQVAPLLQGTADFVGLTNYIFYDAVGNKAYAISTELNNSIFSSGIATSQFMFLRRLWETVAQYPNVSVGEDIEFLHCLLKKGTRPGSVNAYDAYVYVRHLVNTRQFRSGGYSPEKGWIPFPLPHWVDPLYYQKNAVTPVANEPQEVTETTEEMPEAAITAVPEMQYPLISCVVPTSGRAHFLAQSLVYFQQQDYPNKELIIVFNKDIDLPGNWLKMPHLLPANVKLVRTITNVLGAKRNEGNRFAAGTIIAQWDDDDVYGNSRLTLQAMPIINGEADITGLDNFLFYEITSGGGYKAKPELFRFIFQGHVARGTLVHHRSLWDTVARYKPIRAKEDLYFCNDVLAMGARLLIVDGNELFAYLRHHNNTWHFEHDNFRRYAGWLPTAIPAWMAPYTPFYTTRANSKPLPQRLNFRQLTSTW